MMLLLNLTLKNKSSKNKDTPPIHPPHPLNTLPTKRSKAERVGSVIVNTRILSVSSMSSFVSPILRLTIYITGEVSLISFSEG